MLDPQTVDDKLAIAAQNAARRRELSDRLSVLVHESAVRRQRYQNELEAGRINQAQLLRLNDAWQETEREIITLSEAYKKLIPEIRENLEVE